MNQKKLEVLSKRIQELVERKKEPDFDLKIVNPETKTVTIPFKKKIRIRLPAHKACFLQHKNKKE